MPIYKFNSLIINYIPRKFQSLQQLMSRKSFIFPQTLSPGYFCVHFPQNQYILSLNLPLEIRVSELTDLIKNYTKIHELYGEKQKHKSFKAIYLSTKSVKLVLDWVLQSQNTLNEELYTFYSYFLPTKQSKPQIHLSIQYCFQNTQQNQIINPIISQYKFIGRLQGSQKTDELIVRSRKNGKMYSLIQKKKQHIKFNELQQIIFVINQIKKWEKQGIQIMPQFYESFETSQHLNILVQFLPIRLNNYKIKEKQQFQTIIGQIARIFHIIAKQNIVIQSIDLSDFVIGINNKVLLTGLLWKYKTQNKEQQDEIYSEKIIKIWKQLMKNCDIFVVQTYLAVYQYLESGKISSYSQFLRYFQFGRKQELSPRDRAYLSSQIKQKDKGHNMKLLLSNAGQINFKSLCPEELLQFSINFKPLTSIFRIRYIKQHNNALKQELRKQIEDQSTIKKKKISYQQRRNKMKSFAQNKSTKVKKNQSKISEFLIVDI